MEEAVCLRCPNLWLMATATELDLPVYKYGGASLTSRSRRLETRTIPFEEGGVMRLWRCIALASSVSKTMLSPTYGEGGGVKGLGSIAGNYCSKKSIVVMRNWWRLGEWYVLGVK